MVKGCKCYKNNNTGIFDTKLNKFRTIQNKFIPKGVADIYGSLNGRTIYIEVKTPEEHAYLIKHYEEIKNFVGACKKKTHLKNQINFIESNAAIGCIAFFASDLDQVKERVKVTQD